MMNFSYVHVAGATVLPPCVCACVALSEGHELCLVHELCRWSALVPLPLLPLGD